MNQIIEFNGNEVRMLKDPSNPEWVFNDLLKILSINDRKKAASRLPSNEKRLVIFDTTGGPQEMIVVNEPGLYRMIFLSTKPEAEQFKTFIFQEVLPSIRRHGYYSANKSVAAHYLRTIDELMNRGLLPHTAMKLARQFFQVTDDMEDLGDLIELANEMWKGFIHPDELKIVAADIPKKLKIFRFEREQRLLANPKP